MFLAKKLNNGAGPPPATLDPQFNYVTMLLHGDGTNGAQNNTFLDSSSSARTVTRVGTPTQGSFSPYGDNWSNYFDGTGDYLRLSSAVNLTGDFTAEAFIYSDSTFSGQNEIFGSDLNTADGNKQFYIAPSTYQLRIYDGSSVHAASGTVPQNQWSHVAISRQGSTITFYINGVSSGTATVSATMSFRIVGGLLSGSAINEQFKGYISNARLVSGTSIYNGNFTPSTVPLTAVSGTQLLTCQSNRFIDNSSNNYTITAFGNTSVQRFNPFGTATAYSTSVIGGSGYFNTGNYLSVTGLGTISSGENYCYEMWVYPTEFRSGEMRLMGSNVNDPLLQFTNNTDLQFFVNNTFICGYSTTFAPNQWYHIAITKNAGTSYLFVNGIQRASGGNGFGINNKTFLIGAQETSPTIGLIGYMTDFRVWIGTAAYGSNFTPPTSPMTATAFNPLLLNFTNGAIFDNAMMNDLETVGDAQISTSVKKYGTGSIALDGTGDYLKFVPSVNSALGTGNFTVEGWFYITNNLDDVYFFDTRNASQTSNCWGGGYGLGGTSGRLSFFIGAGSVQTSGSVGSLNTWMHIAFVRVSGTLTIYLNGTSVASGSLTNDASTVSTLGYIGTRYTQTFDYGGYMDDLRITKGYARYTANFTPPTAAFFNTGPY
jgi:hypothetical protein